jgi:hypothetical protein
MRRLLAALACVLALAGPALAGMPTVVNDVTTNNGVGGVQVAFPAGLATNDVCLLFIETANDATASSIATQGSQTWAQVTNSPQGTGAAGGASSTRLAVFWARYDGGGTTGPTTNDAGDHNAGMMICFRGVKTTGDPWNITAGNVDATSDTSLSATGATTTADNCLVVIAATLMDDAQNFGATWTNTDLANITTSYDTAANNFGHASGNDGRVMFVTGEKATAGAYGATTNTTSANSTKGMMTIALEGAVVTCPMTRSLMGVGC